MESPHPANFEGSVQTYDASKPDAKTRYQPVIRADGQKCKIQLWRVDGVGAPATAPDLKGKIQLPDGSILYVSLWRTPYDKDTEGQ